MITFREVIAIVRHMALTYGNRAVTNYCDELIACKDVDLLSGYNSNAINVRYRRLFHSTYDAISEMVIDKYYGL